jgi:hypothetical protein
LGWGLLMANNDLLTEEDVRQLIQDLLSIESAAREAQLTQEAEIRQAGDISLEQLIAQETNDRTIAISSLQSSVNQSILRIDGNVTQLQNLFNQRHEQVTQLISQLNASFDTKVGTLDNLRAIILDTKSRMDVVRGDENTVGSIAKALFDAKAYTDQKISQVLNGAPQLLDTLKELSDAIGGDANFFSTINQSIQNVQSQTATNKQEILNLISQSLVKKQLITLTSQHVTQGYVELPVVGIISNSINAFLNRLGIFQDEDFSVSEVNNQTRITFINNFAATGEEAVQAGEQLRVTYWILQ